MPTIIKRLLHGGMTHVTYLAIALAEMSSCVHHIDKRFVAAHETKRQNRSSEYPATHALSIL